MVPVPVKLKELKPDIVFCTHDHIDHLDPIAVPEIAKHYPSCIISGPTSVVNKLRDMGIDPGRIKKLNKGMNEIVGVFKLRATPADHSDEYSVGIIVETESKKIYISGDSRYYKELAGEVIETGGKDIDLALICINGNYNNMNIDEAVDVIKEINPEVASPMHYGLFEENTADPTIFVRKCSKEGIRVFLFETGIPVTLDTILLKKDK